MVNVVSIVEGDGEVKALPVLLRRLNERLSPEAHVRLLEPIKVHRMRFVNRDEEFARFLGLASAKCGDDGWILILLDADDDCPVGLGRSLLTKARAVLPHRRVSVVLANREYEAWFIAASASLNGQRGLVVSQDDAQAEAERPRDAKGWLEKRMVSRHYSPTLDQSAFSATMNLDEASARSRSFRKLCDEWMRQMNAHA